MRRRSHNIPNRIPYSMVTLSVPLCIHKSFLLLAEHIPFCSLDETLLDIFPNILFVLISLNNFYIAYQMLLKKIRHATAGFANGTHNFHKPLLATQCFDVFLLDYLCRLQ